MIKQFTRSKQKVFLLAYLFAFFFIGISSAFSQSTQDISLVWDQIVGCQTNSFDFKRSVSIEDIEDSECLRICEQSEVNYEFLNLPSTATATWQVIGGTLSNQTADSFTVNWGNVGYGSISFTITTLTNVIQRTLCIEKIITPNALFEIAPLGQSQPFNTCSEQEIHFINLSTTNAGPNVIGYRWDFGDGTSSTAFEPTHSYDVDGFYTVTLTVFNACSCFDTYTLDINARRRGFKIDCPTVVCEGQSAIYSLPFDGVNDCNNNFNWSVQGGQILSQSNGNVEVLWDHVDELGFGYVTFDPYNCNVPCREPSTIKVPVVQARGTIQGPTDICLGSQTKYTLPQWPTTDFQWEVVGNSGNNLAEVILTDQRNEVIINPLTSGTIVLQAVYNNTLLQCSGIATLEINVSKPLEINGEDYVCSGTTEAYTNSEGVSINWVLTYQDGTVLQTVNSNSFSYLFNQPGQYLLSADNPTALCAGYNTKNIEVINTPAQPNAVNGDLEVCPTLPYTYAVVNPNPNNEYYWEVTNGTILDSDTGEQVNIVFNGTFPATVSVYERTLNPIICESDPLVLTVEQLPVDVAISAAYDAVCGNSLADYQAFELGTNIPYTDGDTYTWSFSNPTLGSVTEGQGTPAIDVTWNHVTAVTTVDLILTITKCNLNPAPQFTKQITLYPQAEIQLVATESTVCSGVLYPVTFTVQSINGVPLQSSDQVTWDFGAGQYTTAPGVFTQTRTFTNNSNINSGQVVTAYIEDANGCGQTNVDSFTITVLPNPPAIATLTSSANAFCLVGDINATINVSSNTAGVSIEWYKNGVPLSPPQTSSTLTVTPAMGFGAYTFRATNPNGCVSVSNQVNISQVCTEVVGCTINETITNTSYLSACGEITFQGTASGTPTSTSWSVVGSGSGNYSITGNILTGAPGNYKIIHKAIYPCQEGGSGYIVSIKDVIIPFEPDFSYIATCNSDNTFNINFVDNSNFYEQVTNPQASFYYKTVGAASFTGPVAYDPSLSVLELQNLNSGNYIFKIEITGNHPDVPTMTCTKEMTANLQGINPFLSIVVNAGEDIKCHDEAVLFSLNLFQGNNTTIFWNFGDGATNMLSEPERVFTNPNQTYTVTCTITNTYGCSRVLTTNVTIPDACFFGDITASPSPAEVCAGEGITLTYVSNNDNCTVNEYIWMNGNQAVVGAPNSNQLTVFSSGNYWVKVKSDLDCEYASPTQIRPLFNMLPQVNLVTEDFYCEDAEIILAAYSNATTLRWYVDGVLYPAFNNLTEADITGLLPAGQYLIKLEAISSFGCVNTTQKYINLMESIQDITFNISIVCSPVYEATITATASNGSPVNYTWSNGGFGPTIVVGDGGPYRVTADLNGCSISAEIDVPKNPENYIWIFPTGCYEDCRSDANHLIGPLLPLANWSWNLNGQSYASGIVSFTLPYHLDQAGSHSLTIDTGVCAITSEPLEYATANCNECKIEAVDIVEIVPNPSPFCSFTYTLHVVHNAPTPMQVTLIDENNGILFVPSSFTLQPGPNFIQTVIIQQPPFTSGLLPFVLQGTVPNQKGGYDICRYDFKLDIPNCNFGFGKQSVGNNNETPDNSKLVSVKLYPNPASDFVTVSYDVASANAQLDVYDLLGRKMDQIVCKETKGQIMIDTHEYPSGIYMVVLQDDNRLLWQEKLIIK